MAKDWRQKRGAALHLGYLPAILALVFILAAGIVAERQSALVAILTERGLVRDRLETLSAEIARSATRPASRSAADLSSFRQLILARFTGMGADLEVALVSAADEDVAYIGRADVLKTDPVLVPVVLAGSAWYLAGVPPDGWEAVSPIRWPIRILTLFAAGLIVGPMIGTRQLVAERQHHIHELRDRETELVRLSRRLELALDASQVGVWDFHMDRNELVWDERMNELYGYPRRARAHEYTDWRDRLHPEDLARAEAEFGRAVAAGGRYLSEFRLNLPGGVVRHIRAIGAVYREEDESARIVGLNWDVTADVERNDELNEKRLEAEAASVAKSQFLATMSHEIRTPMAGMIGMLDLILRSEDDPEQRERASIACAAAHRLLALLNDILDLSKLEAGRVTLVAAPVDVASMARDVVALMRMGAGGRDLEVRASFVDDLPARLVCDATRLRQVMMNLVGNAVKFTEVGRVEARLAYDPDLGRLEVVVHDTGVGISDADKTLLFQRFAQVDSSRGGTGLGLAISRQLVELMGGEIGVESVPGLGSTFRFTIPASIAETGGEETVRDGPLPVAIGAVPPQRILVAEDNPTNRQILGVYLGMGGHETEMVEDGIEAVEAARSGGFDLVIMDIQMPNMDGITAVRRIRAFEGMAATVPVIALTANALQGDRERCLAAGMSDYIEKPVSLEALYAAMARSLGYSPEPSSGATADQPSPGSNASMAAATFSVSVPRSAS